MFYRVLYFVIAFNSVSIKAVEDLLADLQCEADPVGYIIPDPLHCDRYLDCDTVTGRSVVLCPPGQGVNMDTGVCEEISRVHCGKRQLWRDRTEQIKEVHNRKGLAPADPLSVIGSNDGPSLFGTDTVKQLVGKNITDPLANLSCEKSEEGYVIHDPTQCDRYAQCSPHGVKSYKLCPDGLVLSLSKGVCDFPFKTDCTGREKLQPSRGRGVCVRENGKFPLPGICNQYVDCRGGEAHIQGCGAGAVFDELLGCVHPDQTDRSGCNAKEKYEFQCPQFGLKQRFGDHDRLPHPTDCKKYFVCLRNGLPRLNSCEKPLVFNAATGFCEEQSKVAGCEGYYSEEERIEDKFNKEEIVAEIRRQILKDLGLSINSRRGRSIKEREKPVIEVSTVPSRNLSGDNL